MKIYIGFEAPLLIQSLSDHFVASQSINEEKSSASTFPPLMTQHTRRP
jgi:hypothetical protein